MEGICVCGCAFVCVCVLACMREGGGGDCGCVGGYELRVWGSVEVVVDVWGGGWCVCLWLCWHRVLIPKDISTDSVQYIYYLTAIKAQTSVHCSFDYIQDNDVFSISCLWYMFRTYT